MSPNDPTYWVKREQVALVQSQVGQLRLNHARSSPYFHNQHSFGHAGFGALLLRVDRRIQDADLLVHGRRRLTPLSEPQRISNLLLGVSELLHRFSSPSWCCCEAHRSSMFELPSLSGTISPKSEQIPPLVRG